MNSNQRYAVTITPAQLGGRCPYLRPVVIRVEDTAVKPRMAGRRGLRPGRVVRQWGHHAYQSKQSLLDSRAKGPRSAYGRAMAEAQAIAAQLNLDHLLWQIAHAAMQLCDPADILAIVTEEIKPWTIAT